MLRAAQGRARVPRSRPLAARACSSSATATAAAVRRAACSRRSGARPTCRACRARRSGRARSSSRRSRPAAAIGPSSSGELYFEYHRGVYTSQARTKRGNRRGEQALHDAEFLSCLRRRVPARRAGAAVEAPAAAAVPRHPAGLVDRARVRGRRARSGRRRGRSACARPARGRRSRTRSGSRGARSSATRMLEAAPYGAARASRPGTRCAVDGLTLENAHLRVRARARRLARVACCTRPRGREALAAPGNRLELYEDRPVAFDAWDIDPSALETRRDFAPAASWRAQRDAAARRDRVRAAVA